MKFVRARYIRLDDEHDRRAAIEAGLEVTRTAVGNFRQERQADVVETEGWAQAHALIHDLNRRACALRTKAERSAKAS